MNLKTAERQKLKQQFRQPIEGLQIETGGSVIVSPLASVIRDEDQPSNSKIFMVFGGAIATLLIGTAIGWMMNAHFTQAAKDKAELAAMTAEFNLKKNQSQIDNFCKANSSFRGN